MRDKDIAREERVRARGQSVYMQFSIFIISRQHDVGKGPKPSILDHPSALTLIVRIPQGDIIISWGCDQRYNG